MTPKGPLLGIALINGSILSYALQDASTKQLLIGGLGLWQLLLTQSLVLFPLTGLAWAWAERRRRRMRQPRPLWSPLIFLYAIAGLGTWLGFNYGLSGLPLPLTSALFYTAPLIMTIGSCLILREFPHKIQLLAVFCGFIGVVAIVRPTEGFALPFVLSVVFAATCYALLTIISRRLDLSTVGLWRVVFLINLVFAAASLCALALSWWHWQPYTFAVLALAVTCSLLSLSSTGMSVLGYNLAGPTRGAPFEYLGLLWSTLLAFLIWQEGITWGFLMGAALIVGPNFFFALSESRLHQRGKTGLGGGAQSL